MTICIGKMAFTFPHDTIVGYRENIPSDLTKYIDFEFFVERYGLGYPELKRNVFLENN